MALMRSPDGSETVEIPDAEVQHFLSLGATVVQPEMGTAESRVAGPWGEGHQYSGSEDLGLEDPGLMDPMNFLPAARIGQAAVGLAGPVLGGLQAAGGMAGRAIPAIGRGLGRRAFGKGNFDDMLKETLGKGRAVAPKPQGRVVGDIGPAAPVGSAVSRVSADFEAGRRAGLSQAMIGMDPLASKRAAIDRAWGAAKPATVQPAPVGTTASRTAKPAAKPAAKRKPSRPKKKPEVGTAESRVRKSQAMRGASTPELGRRADAMERATGRTTDVTGDMTDVLAQSLQLEELLTAAGLGPAEKALMRRQPDLLRQLLEGAQ